MKILSKDHPIVFILSPLIIGVFFCLHYYLNLGLSANTINLGLWGAFTFASSTPILVATCILLLINGLLLNLIFNRYGFSERNNFSPGIVYLILLYVVGIHFFSFQHLIAETFFILSIFFFFKLENNQDGRLAIFNATLMLGLVVTFIPQMCYMLIFAWICLFIIRPFVIREFILSLVGFLTPLVYVFCYQLFVGFDLSFLSVRLHNLFFQFAYLQMIYLGIYLVILVIGIVLLRRKNLKSSIRFRKQTSVFHVLHLGVLFYVIFDIINQGSLESIGLSAIFSCLLFPLTMNEKRMGYVSTFLIYSLHALFFLIYFL